MDEFSGDGQGAIEDLIRQVRELQERVMNLEQRLGAFSGGFQTASPAALPQTAAVPEITTPTLEDTTRAFPVLGKALLALAGAYLLRALTEGGMIPTPAGVGVGILYAFLWLVLAARAAEVQKLVVGVHALTSVLVLSPLLWEGTIRLSAIPPWVAAIILTVFAVFGLAVSWRKNVTIVAWITTLGGLATTAVLLIATRDLVPFTLALLAIAAAVEFSACLDHWLKERWIVAITADLAVLLLTAIATREGGIPEGYSPIPLLLTLFAQAALLAVYLASTIVRTLVRGFTFTTFETMQCIFAFLLGLGGALRVGHGTAVASVAVFILLCCVACYTVAFAFLERHYRHDRNFYTYSTFGLILALTGSALLLSELALAVAWSALALCAILLGGRTGRTTLEWHGAVYLALGSAFSGQTAWAALRLLDASGGWAASPAIWVSAAAALCGYVLLFKIGAAEATAWSDRICRLLLSANSVWAGAGVAVGVLFGAFQLVAAGPRMAGFQPTIRTAALTALSMALAWAGARYRHKELVWLVYPFMALTAYELVAQDFQRGHTLALFISLLIYGGALVFLPRTLQKAGR